MAGGWGVGQGFANPQSYGLGSSSRPTTVTAGGSANTYGSWATIASSTAADCTWILIIVDRSASAGLGGYLDIGVGSAGNEIVLVSKIACNWFWDSTERMLLPLSIPAGTRIAARCASSTGSDTMAVGVMTFDSGFQDGNASSAVDTIGFGTNFGTAIPPPSSSNTLGSWTQITASTANDYRGFAIATDLQTSTQGSATTTYYLMNIGVGASGSEKIILPFFYLQRQYGSGEYGAGSPLTSFLPIPIEAGTRIAAQCSCTAPLAPAIGITLYGVR